MAELNMHDLTSIIGNTDKRLQSSDEEDYLLLIRQQRTNECLMIVTDCNANFWLKTIGWKFFEDMRRQMNLSSSELKTFACHFIDSLKLSGSIKKCSELNERKISLSLSIGQGLVMTCSFKLTDRINFDQNPIGFKSIMHKFLLQLWQVKNGQVEDQKKKGELLKKEYEQKQKLQKDGGGIKDILQGGNKKGETVVRKYNLMNPEKKKRRKVGAKLNTGPDCDQI